MKDTKHPLKTILEGRGISQRWLSEKINIGEDRMSKILHNRLEVMPSEIRLIADALEVSIREITECFLDIA